MLQIKSFVYARSTGFCRLAPKFAEDVQPKGRQHANDNTHSKHFHRRSNFTLRKKVFAFKMHQLTCQKNAPSQFFLNFHDHSSHNITLKRERNRVANTKRNVLIVYVSYLKLI